MKKKGSVEEFDGDVQVDMGVCGQVGDGQIDMELILCRQVEVGQADTGIVGGTDRSWTGRCEVS